MSRRRKALYLFIGLALMLGLLALKIALQLRRGEELFWLAELWAPAAVLSIGMVTGIEFMMTPSHGGPAPTEGAPKTRKSRKKPKK